MAWERVATGSRTILAAVAVGVMVLVGCSAAWQERLVDPKLYQAQLAWVAERMGASVPDLPRILVSRQALHEHTSNLTVRASMDRRATIQAAYVPGLIILDQAGFDEKSVWDMGFLVHELVHHVQHMSGRTYACPAAREREAYELQNAWLSMMGEAPAFPESFIAQLSRCPGIREASAGR